MIDKQFRHAWAYGWLKGTVTHAVWQLDNNYQPARVADELRAALVRCLEMLATGSDEEIA